MSQTLEALKRIASREDYWQAEQRRLADRRRREAEPVAAASAALPSAKATDVSAAPASPVQATPTPVAVADEPPDQAILSAAVKPGAVEVVAAPPVERPAQLHRATPWPCRNVMMPTYERLATRLLSEHAGSHPSCVMFTSPTDGDGKTDLLVELSPALAQQSHRPVLLVDVDFRKGDLGKRAEAWGDSDSVHVADSGGGMAFRTEVAGTSAWESGRGGADFRWGGLASLLSGEATARHAVWPTTVPQLSFLPLGIGNEADEDLPNLSALDSVLDRLKCRYSLVILDAPSLAHPHVARMSALCDGVCLVVRTGHTPLAAVDRARQVLEEADSCLWGCIVIGE